MSAYSNRSGRSSKLMVMKLGERETAGVNPAARALVWARCVEHRFLVGCDLILGHAYFPEGDKWTSYLASRCGELRSNLRIVWLTSASRTCERIDSGSTSGREVRTSMVIVYFCTFTVADRASKYKTAGGERRKLCDGRSASQEELRLLRQRTGTLIAADEDTP
jgi:hypothetical protein